MVDVTNVDKLSLMPLITHVAIESLILVAYFLIFVKPIGSSRGKKKKKTGRSERGAFWLACVNITLRHELLLGVDFLVLPMLWGII